MNPHFGTLADVWKHLVLAEVVRAEAPDRYAETHAGHAANPMVDDAERRYGIRHTAAAYGRPCAYLDVVRPYLAAGTYPGSAAIALSIRPGMSAVLADTDPASVADLQAWVTREGLADVSVENDDGMDVLRPWLGGDRALVVIDPFDPWAAAPGSLSAVDFAREAAAAGHLVLWWYGYDLPDDRDWAIGELGLPDVWAGDLLVTTAGGTVEEDGDLGEQTSPGTGCGVLLAGARAQTARRCEQLGEALVTAYAGAPLPDGRPGGLDLLVDFS